MKWTEDDEKTTSLELDTVYPFEIIEAEEKVSQKGNPYINVKLRVFVGDDAKTLFDNLMPQMPAKLKSFCETLGLMDQYNSRSLSVSDCGVGEGFLRTAKKANKDGYAQVDSYLAFDPRRGKPAAEKPDTRTGARRPDRVDPEDGVPF